ncbi:hypothetical protein KKE92_01645 [Candidatus Micrarchaeota archaeon]|jgi:hypothetical protein|nr:hypothetical protein [Candidatus Micrarchaeota archaeon]MBU1682117.1 hypothetical protein [Candidatus Micrarchaeota archaeon]
MDTIFDYSLILAGICLAFFILISIIGSVLEKKMDKAKHKRAGKLMIKIYFVLFIVFGFSLVPIMAGMIFGFIKDVLQADLSEFELPIILLFWGLYIVGLAIAYPVMKRSSFFEPGK